MNSKLFSMIMTVAVIGIFAMSSNAEQIQRTVTTTGTVATRIVPDVIVWHITARDTDKEVLMNAKRHNDEKVRRVLELARSLDVSHDDIQTGTLSVRREYDHDERGDNPKFREFVIRRNITLKQRDFKRFDEFFDKLLSAGDFEASYSFESSRLHELRRETRIKAVKIAREKSEAMCKEAGAKLGKLITISDTPPGKQNRWGSNSNFQVQMAYPADSGGEFEPDKAGGTFAPGAIEIKVTVYTVFGIG